MLTNILLGLHPSIIQYPDLYIELKYKYEYGHQQSIGNVMAQWRGLAVGAGLGSTFESTLGHACCFAE